MFTHSPPNGRQFKSPLMPSVRTEGTFFPPGEPATKPHVGPRCPWGNSRCPLQGTPVRSSVLPPAHVSDHRARAPAARGLPGACGGPGGTGCRPLSSLGRRLGGSPPLPRPAPSRRPKDHSTRVWMWDQGGSGLPALDASRIWMLCDSREWEGRLDLDRTEESLPGGLRGFRSPVPRAVDALVTFGFHRAAPEASSEDALAAAFLEEAEFSGRLWNTPRLFLSPGQGEEQITGRSGGPRFSGHTSRPLNSCPAPSSGLQLLTERSCVESPRPCAPPRERTPHEPGSPWPEEPNLGALRDSGSSAVRARIPAAGRGDSVPAPLAPGGRPCVLLSRILWPPTGDPGAHPAGRSAAEGRGGRAGDSGLGTRFSILAVASQDPRESRSVR